MALYDIVAYTYQADISCPDCIEEIAIDKLAELGHSPHAPWLNSTEQLLNRWAARVQICRDDEHTFDSDDFPKVVLGQMLEGDEYCGRCHELIED